MNRRDLVSDNSLRRLVHDHPGLWVVLCIYIALASSYFFIVPIFEGPDEWTHTGHVAYLAQGRGLPVMLPGQGIWGGQQPPLYYAVGALLVQPFQIDRVAEYGDSARNPHASLGFALDPGNKNLYLHTPAESFPYRGLSLTVHVLRLYSMGLGVITIIFAYIIAHELFRRQVSISGGQIKYYALLPTSVAFFMACQPMFAFITASVANETANMAFSAAGLWLVQRYVLRGPTIKWQRAAALGIILGLISLSKMTGLALGLVAVVALLQLAVTTRKRAGAARLLWRDGFIIGLLFLAVGGWWYWRNYQLYGDFFQEGLYKLYFNVDPQPLTLDEFIYTLSTGEVSFWATFGWLNIVAPEPVYSLYRIVSRVGLLGVVLAIIIKLRSWIVARRTQRTKRPELSTPPTNRVSSSTSHYTRRITPDFLSLIPPVSPLLIHLVFPIALAFSLTRLVAIEGGLQGRQLLPALPSIAIVVVWGWWVLTPDRLSLWVAAILGIILLATAVWLPYGIVAPAYVPRPLLAEADLPEDLLRLEWIYNDEMKLIGATIEADVVKPGQRVPVTAYWQALKPMETNYSVFVHLIGRNYQNVGQFNTYPGLGLRPTTALQPGQIVADTYPVLVNGGSDAPSRLLVNLGLFDFNEPGRPGIQPTAPDDTPTQPTVGQLKLVPAVWPAYRGTLPVAEFADHIWLVDHNIDGCRTHNDSCRIVFKWLAQDQPSTDYTVFIQFWPKASTSTETQFFGFDGPPLGNSYPTSLWAAQEVITDAHSLNLANLPAGEYRILAGLYDFNTGQRLPATAAGTPLPDFAVDLGRISLNDNE